MLDIYNHYTRTTVSIDLAKLDARQTNNFKFEEFTDGLHHQTPQGAVYVSNGSLSTTGLDTCVGISITNLSNGTCIQVHVDALGNHWDLTELLRKRVKNQQVRVELFNYYPPSGDDQDYLFHRSKTVVAVSLQKLGLLEKSEMHSVTLYDHVVTTPSGTSVNSSLPSEHDLGGGSCKIQNRDKARSNSRINLST